MESSSQQWFWKFQQQKQLTLVADSPPARGLTIKIPPRKWDAETMAENAARKITVGWNMERRLTANLVINSASARTKWRVRKCRKITRISTYVLTEECCIYFRYMLRLQLLRTRYVAERYEHAILTTILQHQYYVLQVCRQVSVYICQSRCQLVCHVCVSRNVNWLNVWYAIFTAVM